MVKTVLEDTGERMVPNFHGRTIMYAEHMTRYIAAQELAKGKVVLDIAAGSGYGTNMLAQKAKKAYGVDVSSAAIKYAKENYNAKNIEFLVGDAEEIPLADNSVDLVVTFETIEHIKNYKKFLAEISRVLKDDGLAIVSTPNDEEFAEGNHFHLHEFKYKELSSLLKKNFKYLKPYHQATWAYVQISDDKFIGTEGASAQVEVHNFAPLKAQKYLYFYILCSNREIKEKINNIGGLGGHYSARELGEIFSHYQKQIDDHKYVLAQTKIQLKMREHENHAITQSRSYKVTRRIAKSADVARLGVAKVKAASPKRLKLITKNKAHMKKAYNNNNFTQAFASPATSKLAVVLHLYYVEMLPMYVKRLKNLNSIDHDLYVTIPEHEESSLNIVKRALPDARVAVVPNGGRDVLPFVQVMRQISNLGYTKVLKIHSKKSPHRTDGDEWRERILEQLLPGNASIIQEILDVLDMPQNALVGPASEYVSMLVNLSATTGHIKKITKDICGRDRANYLMRYPNEYGFFGGTMFWARTDALAVVINAVDIGDFEPELGQEDSTLAHALERLFSVIPELQTKNIFESDGGKLSTRNYESINIPAWSEMSID